MRDLYRVRIRQLRQGSRARRLGATFGLALALSSAAQSTGAEHVYKWVDGDGNVHYGDKRPIEEKAEEITISPAPVGDPAYAARQQRTERLLDALTAERQDRDEAREAERKERQERKRNCKLAKRNLANYEKTSRMFRYDENGDIEYLDEDARLAAEEQARKGVLKWCNRGTTEP